MGTGVLSPEIKWPEQENMDIYIHSPIRLHDVVLNYLSTVMNLPPFFYDDVWGNVVTSPLFLSSAHDGGE
jgi:hypothetical protein